jgi:hypothetical protein
VAKLEDLAQAAIAGDALRLRQLAQDWLRDTPHLSECQPPDSSDPQVPIVAAALVELFADRLNQQPPSWTAQIAGLPNPLYLLKSAQTMPRLRTMCQAESPPPLRKRNLFAPANFLSFA